jgi:lysophospholipid acyltransferase (LPLAT)-like uncharacterized protein
MMAKQIKVNTLKQINENAYFYPMLFALAYMVYNVPWLIRPFFLFISWAIGLILYSLFAIFRLTCRVQYKGLNKLQANQNYIYAFWHHHLIPYFITHLRYRKPHVWMNHPLWFMKPVHVILTLLGTKKIALGSSGHGGKKALQEVVDDLQKGYSTAINPDGPAGPPCQLKHGVLDMSGDANVPVVPVTFAMSNYWRLATWDKKRVPLPFSSIRVIYGAPVVIDKANYQKAGQTIADQL